MDTTGAVLLDDCHVWIYRVSVTIIESVFVNDLRLNAAVAASRNCVDGLDVRTSSPVTASQAAG